MQHTFHKIDSPVERAGRRVLCCPSATARAPELSKIIIFILNMLVKIKKFNKCMLTLGIIKTEGLARLTRQKRQS